MLKPGSRSCHLLLIGLFTWASLTTRGQTSSDSLTKQLAGLYAQSQLPGFSVAVVNKEGVLYQQAFGYADLENKWPYTSQTLQPIASVSKTLIGVALMKAVEQGHFTLETSLNSILPFKVENPYFPGKAIQIKHLATHTSGIIDREEIYKQVYHWAKNADLTTPLYGYLVKNGYVGTDSDTTLSGYLAAYLDKAGKNYSKKNFRKSEPGRGYEYSNIGAALAAYLIEVKTGLSFADYTRKFILQPLQMNQSGWFYHQVDATQHAKLYNGQNQVYPSYTSATYPDGELITSNEELSNYLTAILKGYTAGSDLLTKESFRQMLSPQFSPTNLPQDINPREPNQGIFWVFNRTGRIGHTGGGAGASVFLSFSPQTGLGRILITNTEIDGSEALAAQFSAIWKALEGYENTLK